MKTLKTDTSIVSPHRAHCVLNSRKNLGMSVCGMELWLQLDRQRDSSSGQCALQKSQ